MVKRNKIFHVLIAVGIALALIALGRTFWFFIRYKDYGKKEIFHQYHEDFELIKDFFLELTPEDEEFDSFGYSVIFSKGNRSFYLYHPPANWGFEEQTALNHIAEIFSRPWNEAYIRISPTRISFEGLGNERIVFSIDGKPPRYFDSPKDNMAFRMERLGENWFYLRHSAFIL